MTRLQIVKDGPYYVLTINAKKGNEVHVVEIEIARDFQLEPGQVAALEIALNDGIMASAKR